MGDTVQESHAVQIPEPQGSNAQLQRKARRREAAQQQALAQKDIVTLEELEARKAELELLQMLEREETVKRSHGDKRKGTTAGTAAATHKTVAKKAQAKE